MTDPDSCPRCAALNARGLSSDDCLVCKIRVLVREMSAYRQARQVAVTGPEYGTAAEVLPPRELLVIRLRRDGLTYRAIGERLGVTRARAQQIYRTARYRRMYADRAWWRAATAAPGWQDLARERRCWTRYPDLARMLAEVNR